MNSGQKHQSKKQNPIHNRAQNKLQKLILDLNKAGLKLLTEGSFSQAIQYFKKAQRILFKEIQPEQNDCRVIQLSGITYNNLACYYKKTKKPKVALKYLKKALELEVYKLNNWTSIAGTHLNICAIYSYMKSHQQAAHHAELAVSFLQKLNYEQSDHSDEARAYWNVYMLSYYNLAVQKEYLKELEEAIRYYKKSKQIAQASGKRNVRILISCDQSVCRLEPIVQNLRKRMIKLIQKKQESEQKGHAEYILFNKKNYCLKKQNDNRTDNIQNQGQVTNYLTRVVTYNDLSTYIQNRFRTRKVLNNNTKDVMATSFKKRVQSLTSFGNNKLGHKALPHNQRYARLLTQNDVQERNQSKQASGKQFKKSKFTRAY